MAIRKVAETVADRTKFALLSLAELAKQPRYLIVGILAFLVFLYLLTFFRDGGSNWQLIWSGLPLGDNLGVLGRVWRDILDHLYVAVPGYDYYAARFYLEEPRTRQSN